jgi:hypothetical protein
VLNKDARSDFEEKSPKTIAIDEGLVDRDSLTPRYAAWKMYLGVPLDTEERDIFGISPLRPREGSKAKYYYTLPKYEKRLLRYGLGLFAIKENREHAHVESLFAPDEVAHIMGVFTMKRGVDERGKFLQYYDVWDLDPPIIPALGITVDASIVAGKPFTILNKIYYSDGDLSMAKMDLEATKFLMRTTKTYPSPNPISRLEDP